MYIQVYGFKFASFVCGLERLVTSSRGVLGFWHGVQYTSCPCVHVSCLWVLGFCPHCPLIRLLPFPHSLKHPLSRGKIAVMYSR